MDKQQAKHILKNTGYIGNEVGVAFEVAIKSMDKLEKIGHIIKTHDNDSCPEDYWYIDKIREVLEQE
jgi:hypothetical protein